MALSGAPLRRRVAEQGSRAEGRRAEGRRDAAAVAAYLSGRGSGSQAPRRLPPAAALASAFPETRPRRAPGKQRPRWGRPRGRSRARWASRIRGAAGQGPGAEHRQRPRPGPARARARIRAEPEAASTGWEAAKEGARQERAAPVASSAVPGASAAAGTGRDDADGRARESRSQRCRVPYPACC